MEPVAVDHGKLKIALDHMSLYGPLEWPAILSRSAISSVPTLIEQSQLVGGNGLGPDDRLQRSN